MERNHIILPLLGIKWERKQKNECAREVKRKEPSFFRKRCYTAKRKGGSQKEKTGIKERFKQKQEREKRQEVATLLGFNLHCYCSTLERRERGRQGTGERGTEEERHRGLFISMENKFSWLITQLAGLEV